jgi:hypothetical protein
MRRNAAGIAILVLVPVATIVWFWSSAGAAAAPTVPTGAGFSLSVARARTEAAADTLAGRLAASGYPAFSRAVRGEAHDVIVGPFVSIDEADRAQRQLRGQGLGARMLVDESVRLAPGAANVGTSHAAGAPHLVLVGAAGRLSLVLEMQAQPGTVSTRAKEGSLLEIELGPLEGELRSQVWNGPPSASLVNHIAIDGVERDSRRFLRARIALANPVSSQVRVVGSRVYLDMWTMELGEKRSAPAASIQPRAIARPESAVMAPPRLTAEQYQELIAPAIERLRSIEPFATAAVASPSPEILAALAGTLGDLQAWLAAIEPPPAEADNHAVLLRTVESLLAIVR